MARWDRLGEPVRAEWRMLGGLGRTAVIGLGLALVVSVALGFAIPNAVERNLIGNRIDTFTGVAEDLEANGLISAALAGSADLNGLDDAVRHRLIGADVVRVKLWNAMGTIVYSDATQLIGRSYPPSEDRLKAFEGTALAEHPDLEGEEYVTEQGLGSLREYYIPVIGSTGAPIAIFEVYEDDGPIHATLLSTRRWVWLSIAFGLSLVLVFVLALAGGNIRAIHRRRREAEQLLADLARAQEEERHRIIGSLHDDIGQPLYRVLYGIQGSRARLPREGAVAEELERTEELVRWIDGALRSELHMLHQGAIDQLDLDTLLEQLVDDVRTESHLDIRLTVGDHEPLTEGSRAALFRATREAVTNARKHAGATSVSIKATEGSGRVIVDVEDDGAGFDGEVGLGLATTRSRLEAIGGGLTVATGPDGGTLFRAWVPTPDAIAENGSDE